MVLDLISPKTNKQTIPQKSMSMDSFLNYLTIIVVRPLLAIAFVFSVILLGWVLAWKLVLVHVPLVQEICKNFRKKPSSSGNPKPPTRRLSRFYAAASASASSNH